LVAKNKQLIIERNKLNLSTKEGQERLAAINDELNKNNATIKKNSSELEKQKNNVGNYTESLKSAISSSGLLRGKFGDLINGIKDFRETVLNSIKGLNQLVNAQAQNASATSTSTTATTAQGAAINSTAGATTLLSGAFGKLKVALLATGIGAVVLALGAFALFLKKTEQGMEGLEVATAQLGGAFDVLIDRSSRLVNGRVLKRRSQI
jgi:chromosome segregation ATPase